MHGCVRLNVINNSLVLESCAYDFFFQKKLVYRTLDAELLHFNSRIYFLNDRSDTFYGVLKFRFYKK